MSPYNAYSSSLSSSRLSSYSSPSKYSGSSGYSSLSSTSSYRYKPPTYSSTLSSRYRSPSTYTSYTSSSYIPSTLTRNLSSCYLNAKAPKFNSISSYASAITSNDYKWQSPTESSTERLWRSPSISLSRRSSSSSLATLPATSDRSPRPSLPTFSFASSYLDELPPKSLCSAITNEEIKPGRIGLVNLGNTCFMNAVLQCLRHTQPLVDYCVRGTYLRDINHRSSTHGDLMKVFADFVKKITESKTKISPTDIKDEVQRYAPRFSGYTQQDAQEFLRYLLQGMHDDINRVKSGGKRRDYGSDAYSMWRSYKEQDDSIIIDLFAGQLKSTLKCCDCLNESNTYDPFWDLSLPIPEGTKNPSLRQCFRLFTSLEHLDGPNKAFCERCEKKTRSSKKIEINKFPKVLVLHLKRFSASNYGQKLNTVVDFPTTLGNVSDFASSNTLGDVPSYTLYGVVDHEGTYNFGHYTAKCRNPNSQEWHEYNDACVDKISNIISHKAYILFYIQDGRV